jgi:hypothetical protein
VTQRFISTNLVSALAVPKNSVKRRPGAQPADPSVYPRVPRSGTLPLRAGAYMAEVAVHPSYHRLATVAQLFHRRAATQWVLGKATLDTDQPLSVWSLTWRKCDGRGDSCSVARTRSSGLGKP